jgi:hypothetical protein
MQRTWVAGLGVLAAMGIAPLARAADHNDDPHMAPDASADITDVFSWMSADASKVYLVMDVFPNATAGSKFSNAVKYVFHTKSNKSFLDAFSGTKPIDLNDIICTFDANQKISCWVVDVANAGNVKDYVNGDASMAAAPLLSASAKIKAFAGLRDDPFFFNIQGFKNAAAVVAGGMTPVSKKAFTADPKTGCVNNLTAADSAAVVSVLKSTGDAKSPGVDDFTKGGIFPSGNVLSIVLAVDKTLLTSQTGTTIGVWGATTN